MRNNLILYFVFVLFALAGCSLHPNRKIQQSVYYWKSVFNISGEENNYLTSLNINKMYVKFFDVDWNQGQNRAEPAGDLIIKTGSTGLEIIPAVFITNRTLVNINDTLINDLSENIINKILQKAGLFKAPAIKEIQFDCDWAEKTKDKYFRLINCAKSMLAGKNIIISATIRLHQLKYREKTGVPPADKGMLMFYNMSPVSELRTKNSIFDPAVAEKYLTSYKKYPLYLDVALPAFSWGALFRSGKLMALINNLKKENLSNDNFKMLGETRFEAINDVNLNGRFLRKRDIIRIEEITPENTLRAAGMIAPFISDNNPTVAIYNFNDELRKNYDKETLQDIFNTFR